MNDEEAELPYAGTEGHAGSDTSRDRAFREAIDGTASKRQRYILIMAQRAHERGITVADLRDTSLHHGRVSGALSVLHKAGKLNRLRETRDKCKVYVMPQFVNGRETESHGVIHRADKHTLAAAETVEARLRAKEDRDALFDIPPTDQEYADALWALVNYAQGRT